MLDSAIVFCSEYIFGDLCFFFFDDLIDIERDILEVCHLRGHERGFGGHRLVDSRYGLTFFEQVTQFAVGWGCGDGSFEIFCEDGEGFDGGLAVVPDEVLPVFAWWCEDGGG